MDILVADECTPSTEPPDTPAWIGEPNNMRSLAAENLSDMAVLRDITHRLSRRPPLPALIFAHRTTAGYLTYPPLLWTRTLSYTPSRMSEKIQLPDAERQTTPPEPRTPFQRKVRVTAAAVLLLPLLWYLVTRVPTFTPPSLPSVGGFSSSAPVYTAAQLAQAKCPAQPPALNVGSNWNPSEDDAFAALAAKRLSSAVQINTVSFDDLPLDATDPIFDKHYKFSKFLESEYPKLFKAPISHEYINTHGHLFTWPGKNKDLPPILLMAHIDTVPVLEATLAQWTYPPFEGKISVNATKDTPGTWIWGRGSSDCKNSLLGIYNAVEKLIDEGFEPERTILIGNGFDEEVSSPRRLL